MHRDDLRPPRHVAWLTCVAGVGVVTVGAVFGPGRALTWTSPLSLFVVVTVAASLCVVAALVVLVAGHRRNLAEVGLLAGGLFAISVLPLVHGLTAPGVLYGPNEAVHTSAFLALPVALAAWSPLVARVTAFGRVAARHWRFWTAGWVSASTLCSVALLLRPHTRVVSSGVSVTTIGFVVVQIVVALALSHQQFGHYRLSRHRSALAASFGLVLLAATGLVWLGSPVFSVGWWLVHVIDIAGVFAGCWGVYRSHRLQESIVDVLAPVVALDPLVALEVGLAPVVHRFVAALDAKDPITRDHVVRTAVLAVRVGQRIGLPARRLREVGLGALLHDIGKLDVPDAVLTKPDRLTPDEYRAMQRHTIAGDELVRAVPALVTIAPLVITNASTVRATPTRWRARPSRSPPGSSPCATRTTPWPTPGSTVRAWATTEPSPSCASTPAASGTRSSSITSRRWIRRRRTAESSGASADSTAVTASTRFRSGYALNSAAPTVDRLPAVTSCRRRATDRVAGYPPSRSATSPRRSGSW